MSDGTDDTSRNKPVTMYYTAEEKAAIKREANDAGKTVSGYCRSLVERQRRSDDLEQLDAEARLERLITEGVEQFEEIAEGIREQQGLAIHILREIEGNLDDVDRDDRGDRDDQDENGSGKVDDVEDLL